MLVSLARAEPGKLNYYPVNGGSFMIVLPAFVKSEGLDMVHVSYREASLGMQDVAADVRAAAAESIIAEPLAGLRMVARGSAPTEFAAAIEQQRVDLAGL